MVWKPLMSFRWTEWDHMPWIVFLKNPNPRTTHCIKHEGYRNQFLQLNQEKKQNECNNSKTGNNSGADDSSHNNNNDNINGTDRHPKTVYSACNTYGKTNHPIDRFYFLVNAADRPPRGIENLLNRFKFNKKTHGVM